MATWGPGPVRDASCSSEACSGGHGGRGRGRRRARRVPVGSHGTGPGAAASALSEGPQGAAAELPPLQTGGLLSGGENDQQRVVCQSDGGATHRDGGKGWCFLSNLRIRVRRHGVMCQTLGVAEKKITHIQHYDYTFTAHALWP